VRLALQAVLRSFALTGALVPSASMSARRRRYLPWRGSQTESRTSSSHPGRVPLAIRSTTAVVAVVRPRTRSTTRLAGCRTLRPAHPGSSLRAARTLECERPLRPTGNGQGSSLAAEPARTFMFAGIRSTLSSSPRGAGRWTRSFTSGRIPSITTVSAKQARSSMRVVHTSRRRAARMARRPPRWRAPASSSAARSSMRRLRCSRRCR
jgi:hypothetical protein